MKSKLTDFTPMQLDFLSALAIIEEPVSLDLMITLVPLSPGSLVDLIKKAERFCLIKHRETMVQMADDMPAELALTLRDRGTREFATILLAKLKEQERHAMSTLPLTANLSARAGQKFEAAVDQRPRRGDEGAVQGAFFPLYLG